MSETLAHRCECGTVHEFTLPAGSRSLTHECHECGRLLTAHNNDEAFQKAIDDHLALVARFGEDHPEAISAMQRVMALAPPELKAWMHDKAVAFGLAPEKPDGYVEGEPVYRLEKGAEGRSKIASNPSDETASSGFS